MDGNITGKWFSEDLPPEGDVFRAAITRDFPRNTLFRCELLPYKCLKEVGFYDISLKTHEDWDLKIRLTKKYAAVCCTTPLSEYRKSNNSLSKSKLVKRFQSIEKVLNKNLSLTEDLSPATQKNIKTSISNRLSKLAAEVALRELREGKPLSAGRHYLRSVKYQSHLE